MQVERCNAAADGCVANGQHTKCWKAVPTLYISDLMPDSRYFRDAVLSDVGRRQIEPIER